MVKWLITQTGRGSVWERKNQKAKIKIAESAAADRYFMGGQLLLGRH